MAWTSVCTVIEELSIFAKEEGFDIVDLCESLPVEECYCYVDVPLDGEIVEMLKPILQKIQQDEKSPIGISILQRAYKEDGFRVSFHIM